MELVTVADAFRAAQERVNAKCREQGIAPLSGHDVAIIGAYSAFEKAYRNVSARITADQTERFNREVIDFAVKCIATAILS